MLVSYLVLSYSAVGCLVSWQSMLAGGLDVRIMVFELALAPIVFAALVASVVVVLIVLAVAFILGWIIASVMATTIVLVAAGAAFSSFGRPSAGDAALERGGRR